LNDPEWRKKAVESIGAAVDGFAGERAKVGG
jgi:hypothetical protein